MDLGQGKLKRSGINSLMSALHPQHGLAWTDGKAVFLSPVCIIDNELQNCSSTQLGTFDCVHSVSWYATSSNSQDSLLAVVHDTSVSIWKVKNVTPVLNFQQVRKITISAIPQGCLWNPVKDILCILTIHQCSLYFRHLSDKGSFVLPNIDSGNVSCGCWSEDGLKLIVGVGSLLLIYEWRDIEKMVTDYSMNVWKIPNNDGRICSLSPVSSCRFVAATELPLDRLCQANQVDLFHLPVDVAESGTCSDNAGCPSDASNNGSDVDLSSASSAGCPQSNVQKLLNLRRSQQSVVRSDSSQLVVFEVRDVSKTDTPRKVASTSLTGLIGPDLLHFNGQSRQIVVGSNAHHVLYVFNFIDHQLNLLNELNLAWNERPKGLGGYPDGSNQQAVSILVGQVLETHPVFVPSTTSSDYYLSVHLFSTTPRSPVKSSGSPHCLLPASEKKVALSSYLNNSSISTMSSISSANVEETGRTINDVDGLLRTVQKPPIVGPPVTLIQSLDDYDRSVDRSLETEYTDFRKAPARFKSLTFGQHFVGKGDKRPLLLGDSEDSEESTGVKQGSKNSAPSLASDIVNRLMFKSSLDDKKVPTAAVGALRKSVAFVHDDNRAASGETQRPTADAASHSIHQEDSAFAELSNQIGLIRTQMSLQAEQITSIQSKVDHILSQLLLRNEQQQKQRENRRRTLSNADLMYIVDSTGQQKAFVLDNGKLQLDVVKQSFGINSVEFVINGLACVVGSDSAGCIPMDFVAGQTVHISAAQTVIGAFRI